MVDDTIADERPSRRSVLVGAAGIGAAAVVSSGPARHAAALDPIGRVFYNAGLFEEADDGMRPGTEFRHGAMVFSHDPTPPPGGIPQNKMGALLAVPVSWHRVDIYLLASVDNTGPAPQGGNAVLKISNEPTRTISVPATSGWHTFRVHMNPPGGNPPLSFGSDTGWLHRITPASLRRLTFEPASDPADTLQAEVLVWGYELVGWGS